MQMSELTGSETCYTTSRDTTFSVTDHLVAQCFWLLVSTGGDGLFCVALPSLGVTSATLIHQSKVRAVDNLSLIPGCVEYVWRHDLQEKGDWLGRISPADPPTPNPSVVLSGVELSSMPCTVLFYSDRATANPIAFFLSEDSLEAYIRLTQRSDAASYSSQPGVLYFPADSNFAGRECD